MTGNGDATYHQTNGLSGDIPVIVAFICMAFSVCTSFPLNIFPIKFAIEQLLVFHYPRTHVELESLEGNPGPLRVVIGVGVIILSLLVAIAVPQVKNVTLLIDL